MNGDVGHIPLIWIESVFDHVKSIVGDKRVLILSVLGIQSSGKSTLLNIMFGLQFSVSAGRCTRGLYMQLLPVGKNKEFDYILIVDTEGIRAPELKDKRYDHDNELATYVIGIGDVILINIKGENTIELTDILGIVVQALMRLKNVNKTSHLKKRCIFVHQNVAASDANDKMLQQRQNLVEELDERTIEAAEQENVQDIRCFSDILHFDLDNDVVYFPDLWDGSPPMASVNPDYSEHAEKIKDSVLSRNIPGRNTYFTISETVTRMKDLWNGLLADDFVFSFRNNLELKAYMRMQSIFQEISFELETYMNDYVCNECKSAFNNQIETSSFNLSAVENDLERKTVSKLKELQTKLELFFDDDEKKDIVIQWKQSKKNQLEVLYDRLIPNAKKRLQLSADEIKFKLSQDQRIAVFEKKAYKMAKKLASEFKGKEPGEKTLVQRFEDEWSDIIADIKTDDTVDTFHTINSDIDAILCEKFRDQITIIEHFQNILWEKKKKYAIMEKLSNSLSIEDIDYKTQLDISRVNWPGFLSIVSKAKKQEFIDKLVQQALDTTDLTFQNIDDEITKFSKTKNTKFNTTFVKRLLNTIETEISDHNKLKTHYFTLTKMHSSFVLAHTSFYLKEKLSDLNSKYIDKYSLKSKVEQYKQQASGMFRLLVKSASHDSIAVYCFEEMLSTEIIEHVQSQIPTKVAEDILRKYFHSKWELIKEMLKDLATKKSFSDYIRYIQHPKSFAKSYLMNATCKMFFTKTDGKTNYFRIAEQLAGNDFQAVCNIMYDLNQCKESLKNAEFIELLRGNLQTKVGITISSCSFDQVEVHLRKKQTFIELVLNKIESMKESILAKFQVTSDSNVEWIESPYDRMMSSIWGCDAKCPFCFEPCINAQKDHLNDQPHKCASHRVKGVTGRHWKHDSTLCETFCNISVSEGSEKFKHGDESINYKKYKTIYPDWDILPNPETSVYWKWFCCEYKELLELQYGMKMNICNHWKGLSKSNAIESIDLTSG